MSDPINANPTVLDEAALPTRKSFETKKKTFGILDPSFEDLDNAVSVFDQVESAEDSESENEGGEYEEPIDAQEIYGGC
jgi:hypothetical protein